MWTYMHAQTRKKNLLVFMQLLGNQPVRHLLYMVYKYAFFCVTDLKIDMKVVDRRRRYALLRRRYALCGHGI